jgi:hypothetical protein
MTFERVPSDQGRANMLKAIRAVVRLKHSIAADEELNVKLPAAEKIYNAKVLRGELPDAIDILKRLEEEA